MKTCQRDIGHKSASLKVLWGLCLLEQPSPCVYLRDAPGREAEEQGPDPVQAGIALTGVSGEGKQEKALHPCWTQFPHKANGVWSLGSNWNLSCFTVTLWYVDNHATFYQKLRNYNIWICKLPIKRCLSHMVIGTTKDSLVQGFNFQILLWFCTSPTRGRFDPTWSDLAAKEQPPADGFISQT